ncbi:hypothetical protein ABBQ38_007006 [Trebouxia sp. C0009 RCD-2024]
MKAMSPATAKAKASTTGDVQACADRGAGDAHAACRKAHAKTLVAHAKSLVAWVFAQSWHMLQGRVSPPAPLVPTPTTAGQPESSSSTEQMPQAASAAQAKQVTQQAPAQEASPLDNSACKAAAAVPNRTDVHLPHICVCLCSKQQLPWRLNRLDLEGKLLGLNKQLLDVTDHR